MKRLFLTLATIAVLVPSPALAQQGTGDLRGQVVDQQDAALPGVAIVLRHQESGLFRETVSGGDGTFFFSGMTPGVYEVTAELSSFKKYQARGVRIEVGKTAQITIPLEVGGLTESVTVSAEAPLVDTIVERDRRQHHRAGVRRYSVVQPQLRGIPRDASGRRRDDLGDDVWRRLDQRRGPERPQRQLHHGRVEQQRHVQRRQRRRAGTRPRRGGAGVSTAHQPVRRRVRPGVGRHRELGVQAGHESVSRQRVLVLPGPEARGERVLCGARGSREGRFQAATVGRHVRWSNRSRQGALLREPRTGACSTRESRPISRPGPISTEPISKALASGTRLSAPTIRSTRAIRTGFVGCAKPRRSRCRFRRRTTRHRATKPRPTSTGRWSATSARSSARPSSTRSACRRCREDVFFGNPNFNSNGHNQKILLPQLELSELSRTSRAHAPTAGSMLRMAPTTCSRGSSRTREATTT